MKKIFSILFLIAINIACTDLEEEILDEALNSDLLEEAGAAEGIIAPVYGSLNGFTGHEDYFLLQGVTTDEAIVPFRGGTDWFNGGVLIEMHQHTWSDAHPRIDRVWGWVTQGIARATIAINTLANIDDPNTSLYTAEARGMSAFYNYILLDLFNLAFVKDPADLDAPSIVLYGEEAFDYIIGELDAVEGALRTKAEVGSGRFTKGAVWGLKTKMYLNKTVYVDPTAAQYNFSTEDLDQTIEYATRLISSANHALETEDYFNIFDIDNHNNPEMVFAIDHRDVINNAGRFTWFALARNQHGSLINPQSTGTDGASITPDFYATWEGNRDDPRYYKELVPQDGSVSAVPEDQWGINRGILQGQQYGIVLDETGSAFKRDSNGNLIIEMLFNTRRTGEPVDFTVAVDLEENTGHSKGARVSKYEFDPLATNGRNVSRVDLPLIRMGDIYLMRAEAYLRKGDVANALVDLNTIRNARNHPRELTSGELNLETLFLERGYEMYWEMVRRTDMIRFGKFEDSWTSKSIGDPERRVFPIPRNAIDANPELFASSSN